MALKGSAVIELTDVKTGKKEIVKHDNLVTNAVNDILSSDPFHMNFGNDNDQFSLLFPVVNNLIGGVVLFQEPLEENADRYYAPETNDVIGYSNMDVSDADDPKRGSLNQSESGQLEDGTGYRFVFDFATSQGNGEISALSLTSQSMGACGYGSKQFENFEGSYANTSVYVSGRLISSNSKNIGAANARMAASITSIDIENSVAYAVEPVAKNKLSVYKFNLLTDSAGLFTTKLFKGSEPETIAEITTSAFLSSFNTSTTTDNYVGFCDGEDGYIWGFQISGNVLSGTTVLWIKINKTDWSFTEGTWSLPTKITSPGTWRSYPGGPYTKNECKCIVHNGLAYFAFSDYMGVVMVNTTNPSDITVLETKNKVSAYSREYSHTLFNLMGDVVVFAGGYIADRTAYPANSAVCTSINKNDRRHSYASRPNLRIGPYIYCFLTTASSYIYMYKLLDSAYLATINNLDKPVQKTADKTMKITYILREEA